MMKRIGAVLAGSALALVSLTPSASASSVSDAFRDAVTKKVSVKSAHVSVQRNKATATVTVETNFSSTFVNNLGVCVRKDNDRRSYSFEQRNLVRVNAAGTTYTAPTKAFLPGTYHYAGCFQNKNGVRVVGAEKTFVIKTFG